MTKKANLAIVVHLLISTPATPCAAFPEVSQEEAETFLRTQTLFPQPKQGALERLEAEGEIAGIGLVKIKVSPGWAHEIEFPRFTLPTLIPLVDFLSGRTIVRDRVGNMLFRLYGKQAMYDFLGGEIHKITPRGGQYFIEGKSFVFQAQKWLDRDVLLIYNYEYGASLIERLKASQAGSSSSPR